MYFWYIYLYNYQYYSLIFIKRLIGYSNNGKHINYLNFLTDDVFTWFLSFSWRYIFILSTIFIFDNHYSYFISKQGINYVLYQFSIILYLYRFSLTKLLVYNLLFLLILYLSIILCILLI